MTATISALCDKCRKQADYDKKQVKAGKNEGEFYVKGVACGHHISVPAPPTEEEIKRASKGIPLRNNSILFNTFRGVQVMLAQERERARKKKGENDE